MPVVNACQCAACLLQWQLEADPDLSPCRSAGQHAAHAGRAASPRSAGMYRHIANFDHWPICLETERQQKVDPAQDPEAWAGTRC